MPRANKVLYGLKNVHWAPFTTQVVNGQTIYSYGTPVPFPGAVSLGLDPQGDLIVFYADDGDYFVADQNSGYEGPFVCARVPENFRTEIMRELADDDGSLIESSIPTPEPFAMMFEMAGDAQAERCVLYNCTVRRVPINPETRTNTATPQTRSMTLRASPRADGVVKKQSGANTTTAAYAAWYAAVPLPTPASASLTALTIGELTLTPAFAAGTTAYNAETGTATAAITATPVAGATAVVMVNGTVVASGADAAWREGANSVTVAVTDADGITVVYLVNVTYTPAGD